MLAHAHDECTGSWHLEEETVLCRECGRAHLSTPEIRSAAMAENFAGRMLQLATARGTSLLSREKRTSAQ